MNWGKKCKKVIGTTDARNWVNFGHPVTSIFLKKVKKTGDPSYLWRKNGTSNFFDYFKIIKISIKFEKTLKIRRFPKTNSCWDVSLELPCITIPRKPSNILSFPQTEKLCAADTHFFYFEL